MQINKSIEGTTLTLAPSGMLNAATSPELEEVLEKSIEGIENINFDFAEVTYISSAGIRVVVSAVKLLEGRGEVKVKNANDEIQDVFELTGLMGVIEFE